MKLMSCGIIFQDIDNNILIVRPTNSYYYQIPKGLYDIENDITHWDTAQRESYEETGIDLKNYNIINKEILGQFKYLEYKDLYLFRLTLHRLPDIKELHCKSTFYNKIKKVREPEVDEYRIINIKDYPRWLNKNLIKVFDKIYKE
jgi:8-oxo-dGTP pyrophosphatase MutT (NUDIX family)